MKKFFFTISLLILAGCITSQFSYSNKKVKKYLVKNPGVPPQIAKALDEARLEKGMTMTEVQLCWGPASEVKATTPPEPLETIWKYTKSSEADKSLPSSAFWERAIPLYTATFGANNRLVAWKIYGKKKTRKQTSAKRNTRGAGKTKNPSSNPGKGTARIEYADLDDLTHWPSLTFSSMLVKGDSRSVIINGQILDEGDQILGIKILKITTEGAKMQFGKEIQFLKKGTNTR